MSNITITCSPEQAQAMVEALECFTRINLGQLEHIEGLARLGYLKKSVGDLSSVNGNLTIDECDDLRADLKDIKQKYFGFDRVGGSSHGLGSIRVNQNAHRVYCAKKQIEQVLANMRNPSPSFRSVDYDGCSVSYVDEPVVQVSVSASSPQCPSEVGGNIDPDFEEALDRIRTWPISQSYALLFDFIKNCAWQDEFGKVSVSDADDGEVEYTFVTGGWSDNEEILAALKSQRLAWALTWQRSERGGKHVFRVKSL